MNTSTQTTQLSAIERALAAAKARKAAREANEDLSVSTSPEPTKPTLEPKVKLVKSDADREEFRAARAAERETRRAAQQEQLEREKAERLERRNLKKAEKAAVRASRGDETRGEKHMKKVETARSKLPRLEEEATRYFNEVSNSLSASQIEALSLHLQFHNRMTATKSSPAKPIPVGTSVQITAGDHRFVGKSGTVTRSQKLRSYVQIPGVDRELYIFTSYLQPTSA